MKQAAECDDNFATIERKEIAKNENSEMQIYNSEATAKV